MKVHVPEELGTPYKVRVGYHDDTVSKVTWQLDKVSLHDLELDRQYDFNLAAPVARDLKSHEGWKEIPIEPTEKEEEEKGKEGEQKKDEKEKEKQLAKKKLPGM